MFLKNITKTIIRKYQYFKFYKQAYSNLPNHLNIKINDINLSKYIIQLENEYEKLKSQTVSLLSLEHQERLEELQRTMNILELRKDLLENITNLDDLLCDKDSDIRELAEDEKRGYLAKLKRIDDDLLETLLPADKYDNCHAIMLEVNAGVGGQEAMLFAKELFNMYCSFAEYKNWDVEIAECAATELGGIRHGSVLINGSKVFQYFKYEAGVHRVQRIPTTEKSGRMHTSTVSVLAFPQPTDIQIKINSDDLRIETKRASGAGGQHVNTTDSAVRITHIPTGLSAECQVDRSQHKNKSLALQKLRTLLYDQQLQNQIDELESTKKSQVRTNFRNEKIRTYNFNQDRITDHRLQGANVHNLKVFLEGGASLETLILKLHNSMRLEKLLTIVKELDVNRNFN